MSNYEIAAREVSEYDGVLFRDDREGEFWYCIGVLIAPEDLYYEMVRNDGKKRQLLSFVGSLESFGFEPVINN